LSKNRNGVNFGAGSCAWLPIVSRREKRVLGVNQHNTALEIITIIIGGGLIIVVPLGVMPTLESIILAIHFIRAGGGGFSAPCR